MDPWAELRERASLVYLWAAIPDTGRYYHSSGAIVLKSGLGQAARRSVMAHELVHAERGDGPCATAWHEVKQERAVDEEAARRLITMEALVRELLWSQDEVELADALWVDVATVKARLAGLTPGEKDEIERRIVAAESRMP